jgi:hypothetical protein
MQLYIHRDGQQTGPHSLDEVKAQLASGVLHPSDLAWYDGAADWAPLSAVPGVTGSSLRLSSREDPAAIASLRGEEPCPPKHFQPRTAIVLCLLVSGLFSLVCLLTTLLLVSSSTQKGFPWGTLLGGLLLTVTGISITAQLLVALRSGPPSGACVRCGKRKQTISVGLNRHIGAVILMFHKSLRGQLCKECISQVFWEYMLITVLFGWWGVISVFLTPVVLINNSIVYARSRLMTNRY